MPARPARSMAAQAASACTPCSAGCTSAQQRRLCTRTNAIKGLNDNYTSRNYNGLSADYEAQNSNHRCCAGEQENFEVLSLESCVQALAGISREHVWKLCVPVCHWPALPEA